MAKIISVQDLANKLVGKVEFDDKFKLKQEPIVAVYEEHLPNELTMKDARALNKYNKHFFHAHSEVAGTALADLYRGNTNIETLDAVTDCAGTKFGVFFSKPMNEEPTTEDFGASLGFGISTPIPRAIEKELRGKLASMFMSDVDSVDEDDSDD